MIKSTNIDFGQTVHRFMQWVLVAFVSFILYIAKEVRDDVKSIKQTANDERVIDASQEAKIQAHEHRISQLEKFSR